MHDNNPTIRLATAVFQLTGCTISYSVAYDTWLCTRGKAEMSGLRTGLVRRFSVPIYADFLDLCDSLLAANTGELGDV